MAEHQAYPGIYMVCDPRPGEARARVQAMLENCSSTSAANPHGIVITNQTIAIEGPGFAIVAESLPAAEPSCGPGLHCDSAGVLIWTGEMFLPASWTRQSEHTPPNRVAAIVRQKLLSIGPAALAEIDGSFCGAWYDGRRHTWTVFNDRWGLIPLFWWADRERLVVSPRARLTWQASGSPLQIDENAVADLLRTQNMLDDHTLIADVHWLEPAHTLSYTGPAAGPAGTGTRLQRRRYWDFQHKPQTPSSCDAVIDSFLDASRTTIARMTDSKLPLMQGLSGGLDSRVFLAVAHELGRVPACYTSGFAYSEDMRFGRQLARMAGASHDALLIDAATLPEQLHDAILETEGLHGAGHLGLSAPIGPYLQQHRGAILIEGYLHGVLGGSDLPFDEDIPPNLPPHEHSWARDFLHGGGDPDQIGALLREDLAAESLGRWQSHVDDSFRTAPIDDPLHRAEYTIITGRSGRNDVLVPASFRRHTLARHPACDRRMIEWYATTPAQLRRARQVYVDVLRQRFPKFASVPRADSSSGMPLIDNRWLREYCWQRERLYSWWSKVRHADVRRYGRDSLAARAWTFETCRQAGLFEPMLATDARVRAWVRQGALQGLWSSACANPRRSIPLLTLLTAETMIRELERTGSHEATHGEQINEIHFRRLSVGSIQPAVLAEVS